MCCDRFHLFLFILFSFSENILAVLILLVLYLGHNQLLESLVSRCWGLTGQPDSISLAPLCPGSFSSVPLKTENENS